jgi:hypothetical protein
MLSVPAEVTANCCSAVRGCFWSTEMPQMLHVSSIGANGHEWQPIRVGGGSATHPLVHCEPPCATSARASLPRPRHAAAPSPVCVRRCRDSKQAVTLTHKVANQVQKEEEKKSDLPRTCGALEHRRKVRVMVISTPKLKPENRGLRPAMFIKRPSILQLLLVSKLHVMWVRPARHKAVVRTTERDVAGHFSVGSHGRTRSVPSAACSLAHRSFAMYPCTVHGMNDTCFCCLSYFSCLCSM